MDMTPIRTDLACLPLQQHPAFGRALDALGVRVELHHFGDPSRPVGQALTLSRRLWPFGPVALASRGPVWSPLAGTGDRIEGLRMLARRGLRIVNSDRADPAEAKALDGAGFRHWAAGQWVAELDLTPDADRLRRRMAANWRNHLSQARRAGLTLANQPFHPDPHHWLLGLEAKQARARHYVNLPPALPLAYARNNPGMARLLTAHRDGERIAAMLVLCHGSVATYHIGWSGAAGRAVSAHHLMLHEAALWLAARGYQRLDLGIADRRRTPGLAGFKAGSGASLRQLGGTWIRLGRA